MVDVEHRCDVDVRLQQREDRVAGGVVLLSAQEPLDEFGVEREVPCCASVRRQDLLEGEAAVASRLSRMMDRRLSSSWSPARAEHSAQKAHQAATAGSAGGLRGG